MSAERFFAPCPRGLEAALAAELPRSSAQFVAPAEGGVGVRGPARARLSRQSRVAHREPRPVAGRRTAATATRTSSTRSRAAIDWARHFNVERTLRVDVAATRSPLQSLEFATLKVKDAVCDRFRDDAGKRPSVDKQRPDVRVHAYLTEREATLYLDTSGEPLFKRGWRRDTDAAPLRENLAAGLIALVRLDARHAVPRSDVRQRHDRDRGGAARRRPRAGTHAHVRLPEARLVRRPDVAAHPPARARSRAHRAATRRRSSRATSIRTRSSAAGGNAAAAGVRGLARRRTRPTCSRARRPRRPAC